MHRATASPDPANNDPWELRTEELTPNDALSVGPPAQSVALGLREGKYLSDRTFDNFLPSDLRLVSNHFWTPLDVIARVCQWLDEFNIQTIMDIGSGAGKFCVAGALASRCQFVGLEQRPHLVAASRRLARRFGIDDRATFVEGVFGETPIPVCDAYYLFNPFEENIANCHEHLDETVELTNNRFLRDVAASEAWMRSLPVGTYLLTYNGFGARIPKNFREIHVDRDLPQVLRMSIKKNAKRSSSWQAPDDCHHPEVSDETGDCEQFHEDSCCLVRGCM